MDGALMEAASILAGAIAQSRAAHAEPDLDQRWQRISDILRRLPQGMFGPETGTDWIAPGPEQVPWPL